MPFQPWQCNACKRHGQARHAKNDIGPVVMQRVAISHSSKSRVCALKFGHKFVDVLVTPVRLKT